MQENNITPTYPAFSDSDTETTPSTTLPEIVEEMPTPCDPLPVDSDGYLQLPLKLKTGDFVMTQVMRTSTKAIYEGQNGYEVIRITKRPAESFFGRQYPARESYPSTSDWGTLAWSYITFPKALKQYERLA